MKVYNCVQFLSFLLFKFIQLQQSLICVVNLRLVLILS